SKAYAGYKLLSGEIDVQTRVPQNESVFALALEELDRQQKLPIPELVKIHNIGQWVTYTMVLLALIIGIYTYSSSGNLSWSQAEKILMILLLAGTTSFILSSRLIFVSAIARLSQWGIYVKRSDIWWTLANIQQLLVEKTGTLTYNRPEVTEVVSVGSTPIRSVISLAASLCVKGEKRLHRTILRHAKSREAEFEKAVDIVPHHNGALEGTINNKRYQLAPSKRLAEMGLDAPEVVSKLSIWETETTNALLLFEEGKVIGVITFTDPIREEIGEFVDMLRVAKVKEITLLTSDNAFPTNAFAHRYGYDVAVGELDTDDKIKYVNNKFDAQPNTILMSNNRNLTDNCYALTACVDNASARTPMKRGDISIIPGDPTYVTHVFRIAKTATGRLKNMIVLMVLFKLILGWFVLTGKITLWETAAAELVFAVYALFTAISPNSASKVQLPKPETGIVLKPSSRTRSLMRSGRRKKGLIF
ncbi:MAG: HAD family hydrolase, partial [Gammaproteobacteria bacterium]|nr:HAD family hydrolase [Gammaproteobacteria bacterium]